jgi:small subunit ribosomal protein S6
MNCYEHVFITKGDLSERESQKVLEKYSDIINSNSGKMIKTEKWGLRNFTYKINNLRKGFYFHLKFEGVVKTIKELERTENIDETLIRFLTVKVKKHDLETNYFDNKKEIDKK